MTRPVIGNTKSSWGLFSLLPAAPSESVHPDDAAKVTALSAGGHVLQLIAESPEYLTLRYEGGDIRVKPEQFLPLPAAQFPYAEHVQTVPPRSPISGEIRRIIWHHKDSAFDYYLTVNARPHKARYRAAELIRT